MEVILLKKFIACIITIFVLILTLTIIPSSRNALAKTIAINTDLESSTQSKEELYQDIYNTLLFPYIQTAIETYYKKPVAFDIFGVKTLQITRPNSMFTFTIKLQLLPYIGAHNSVGIDNITFKISPGEVKMVTFEHIKSFPIPNNLQ